MLFTLVVFLAILAVLVISHEFGHFIAARKSGMKVYEFGFGFPPRLVGIQATKDANGKRKFKFIWGRDKKNIEDEPGALPAIAQRATAGTVYSFNLIPLGGFVRIKGEEGQEIGPDSFVSKPAWQKARRPKHAKCKTILWSGLIPQRQNPPEKRKAERTDSELARRALSRIQTSSQKHQEFFPLFLHIGT